MRRSRKTEWSKRSPPQRMFIVLVGAVEMALMVAAEADIQRRPASQIKGSKLRWRLICLINVFGPLSYYRWGRIRSL